MILPPEQLHALLMLNRLGRRKAVVELLQQGRTPIEILAQFSELPDFNPLREMESCEKRNVRLLTWFDRDYPVLLKEIADPPLVLYMKGVLEEADQAAVAIVGTRHPSFYGQAQARKFSRGLAEKGMTVISGFARGIDQTAHEAALEVSSGRTIAILGCGIDVDYPKGSAKLSGWISERGAVLTEYPLGTAPRAENFPRRNRIISGLSQGVLVIEAHTRSGSLITANEAAEQGRQVFAVPGPVDQLSSKGAHKLIREGATLVESAEDIMEALAPALWPLVPSSSDAAHSLPISSEAGEEKDEVLIMRSLKEGPRFYNEILGLCVSSVPANRLMSLLTRMELGKKISKGRDGKFVLNRG